MAYNSWSDLRTTRVWAGISIYDNTTTVFSTDIKWKYCTDNSANKTKVFLDSIIFTQHLLKKGWGLSGCTLTMGAKVGDQGAESSYSLNSSSEVTTLSLQKTYEWNNQADGTSNAVIAWKCTCTGSDQVRPTQSTYTNYSLSSLIPKTIHLSVSTTDKQRTAVTVKTVSNSAVTVWGYGYTDDLTGNSDNTVNLISVSSSGTENTYTYTGLQEYKSYRFVTAVKDGNNWTGRVAVQATTLKRTPVITNLQVTDVTLESATLLLSSDAYGDSEHYYTVNSGGADNYISTTATEVALDLEEDTEYTIKAYVKDSTGEVSEVQTITFKTGTGSPQISSASISSYENDTITVSIDVTLPDKIEEYQYSLDQNSFYTLETTGEDAYKIDLTGMLLDTDALLMLRLKNTDGEYSNIYKINFRTRKPLAPVCGTLSADVQSDTEIDIIFTGTHANEGASIAQYYVYCTTTNKSFYSITNTVKCTGLPAKTECHFRAKVFDNHDTQSDIQILDATTQPPQLVARLYRRGQTPVSGYVYIKDDAGQWRKAVGAHHRKLGRWERNIGE